MAVFLRKQKGNSLPLTITKRDPCRIENGMKCSENGMKCLAAGMNGSGKMTPSQKRQVS